MIIAKVKKLFVDIPSALLMIICFATALFIVFNTAELVSKIAHEKKEMNRFAYSVDMLLDLDNSKKSVGELIDYLMTNQQTNISLADVHVFINNEPANYVCNIILNYDEDLIIKSAHGDKIDLVQDNSGSVLLGETMAEYLNSTYGDSSEIRISELSLPVISILENNMSGGVDTSVWIIWDKLSLVEKEALLQVVAEQMYLRVNFKSNTPLNDFYNNFILTMNHEWGIQPTVFNAYYDGSYQNLWHQTYGMLFNGLSLLFITMTIFVAMKLWFLRRKKEIVIRIIYGYSAAKIMAVLAADLLKITGMAMIFALLLQLIYCHIFSINMNLLTQLPVKFGTLLLCIFILSILLFAQLMHEINKISIVKGLGREE